MIDLRSDTLTRPTPAMRRAMADAEVGDDVYDEDPTVHALQERVAGLFGKEAALFTPTGSMANVLALASLVGPGQEVLCEARAHILRAELGAHGAFTGLTSRTWSHPRGQVDLPAIEEMYAPDMGPFFVRTTAVSVENTHNFAGGAVLPLDGPAGAPGLGRRRRLRAAHGRRPDLERARRHRHPARGVRRAHRRARGLPVQGARRPGRLAVRRHAGPDRRGPRARKRMGGGMRQVGVLAAAGLHAIDHHLERMAEDHEHARLIAEACGVDPATVDTNIVVVDVPSAPDLVAAAAEQGVRVGAVGPRRMRLLTHLDVTRDDAERAAKVLASLL